MTVGLYPEVSTVELHGLQFVSVRQAAGRQLTGLISLLYLLGATELSSVKTLYRSLVYRTLLENFKQTMKDSPLSSYRY